MSQDNDIEIKGHDYDGIKEFDNPLPGWWLITFYGTIIFAFLYVIHYEFGGGPTLAKELDVALKEIQSTKTLTVSTIKESEEDLQKQAKDPKMLALGMETYNSKCGSCHGNELQGLIGPNLTDKFWIHGKGKMQDLIATVNSGVADKGMPPWEGILKKEEIIAVAGYIQSKKDSNPSNPKPAQGDPVE